MKLIPQALFGAVFFCVLVSAQAQLTFEQKEIELHPKAGDAEAIANFKYTNKTAKTINIKNVRTSCGCTVAALKKNSVAPGEAGEVTATFKIGGRTGTQQKAITVETDDPAQPTVGLVLKAVIPETVLVQPPFVAWESGEAAKAKTITVKAASPEVKIGKLDVTSSNADFTTAVEKGKNPNEFIVSVTPKDTAAAHFDSLTLKPDLPQPFYATARVNGPNAPKPVAR
ncbi:MAG: DUF1573 domain-containing protein [Chthoniobacterales bacterium]